MKNKQLAIGVVLLVIITAAGYFYIHSKDAPTPIQNETPVETFTSEMHGMHNMPVLDEKAFLEEMIPHHQEAVDTAKEVAARGENAEVKALAEAIIVAQEKEIADMKSWYKEWYGEAYADDGEYEPMMPDLVALSGTEIDRAFLEGMIEHHMGALMMAQQVSMKIEHPEIATLAKAIAETQSAEIIEMRILLKQL